MWPLMTKAAHGKSLGPDIRAGVPDPFNPNKCHTLSNNPIKDFCQHRYKRIA